MRASSGHSVERATGVDASEATLAIDADAEMVPDSVTASARKEGAEKSTQTSNVRERETCPVSNKLHRHEAVRSAVAAYVRPRSTV
jgi:hypothetical protein